MAKTSKENQLAIIIPVSSKEAHVHFFLSDLVNKLKQDPFFLDWPYQIIIVINGSRAQNIIDQIIPLYNENPQLFKIHVLNKASYGEALKLGFTRSCAPIVASFDIDFWDVDFLKSAIQNIIDYDIVIASKNIKGSSDDRSFLRRLISLGFSYLLKIIFNINISDTHSIKVWNAESKMRYLFDVSMPFDHMYDSEIIIRAALLKFKILELPVFIKEKRPTTSSILKRLPKAIWELFLLIWRIYRRDSEFKAVSKDVIEISGD